MDVSHLPLAEMWPIEDGHPGKGSPHVMVLQAFMGSPLAPSIRHVVLRIEVEFLALVVLPSERARTHLGPARGTPVGRDCTLSSTSQGGPHVT